jgi:hypothetical protein
MHMRPGRLINQDELTGLHALRKILMEGRGWERGGVRGWILGAELNDLTKNSVASLYLQRLRQHGLVLGETAYDPGRKQPVVLWRLTQLGEMDLAWQEKREPEIIEMPVPDPKDQRVLYLPMNAWRFLEIMKREHPRWVRWRDAVAEARRESSTWIYPGDALLLSTRGLVEREDEGEGRGKIIWYRATTFADETEVLDDLSSENWVQLLLPEPATKQVP